MRQLAEFKRYRAHLCAGLAHSDSDDEMLRRVAQWVVPSMDCGDGGWWIVDDTGFPKQGIHSVGVARQCCGKPGKQDNCQVAVSVSRWLARAVACPWLGACTCARIGAKTRRVATRPAFPRTSGLGPRRRSPWRRSSICSGRVLPGAGLGAAPHERPVSMKDLAKTLPVEQWQNLEWSEGSARSATSRRPSRACGCALPQPCSGICQGVRADYA
jgi:hypothetical protein